MRSQTHLLQDTYPYLHLDVQTVVVLPKPCVAQSIFQSAWVAGLQKAFWMLPEDLLQGTGYAFWTQTVVALPEVLRGAVRSPIRLKGWPPKGLSEVP